MKDRYIDSDDMLMEYDWKGEPTLDDALWRTAILNIITGGKHPTDECYDNGRVFRHPIYERGHFCLRNTCSRDQVVMDQVSRKILKIPLPRVRIKFSDKFSQTPDMILWMRAIRGSRLSAWFFLLYHYISLPILFKRNDRLWKKGKERYFRKGLRSRYPFYAFHLLSWMVYVLPPSRMKRKINEVCLKIIIDQDPTNDLLWLLHGGGNFYIQEGYEPQTDFRWQRQIERLEPGVELSPYSGPFPIDKDILSWAVSNELEECHKG